VIQFTVMVPVSSVLSQRRRQLLEWTLDRYLGFWDENELKIVIGTDDSEPFNRAKARNIGLAQVDTEYVLIADGDTACEAMPVNLGLNLLDGGAPWVIPYGHTDYYNLTEDCTNSILDNPMDPIMDPQWDHKIHSWAGLLLARTEDCRKIGGYDERFDGWGWEDLAFMIKMDHCIGPHRRTNGRALHLWHPRGDDEFGTPQESKNRALFDKEYRIPYDWHDERLR